VQQTAPGNEGMKKRESVDDRIDRATIDASVTFGTGIIDRVLIASRNNRVDRTGLDTGTTGNTIFGNLQGHFTLLTCDE
jgi:hypothetical protein